LRTGKLERLWLADGTPDRPPYGTAADTLLIAYYSSAEWGCHLALGWPMPTRCLDLYAEFRCRTSGLPVPCGNGLLGALAYFGLDSMAAAEKQGMRELAMRGGPYTQAEQAALLEYCQSDVDALSRLLPAMLPGIDLPRALLRGRYMAAVARMEWAGIPIDTDTLARLRSHWDRIKGQLVAAVNRDYDVFVSAGLPPVDPESRLGAAIIEEARAWGVDPQRLATVVDFVWREEREATAELVEARRAARRATGLTAKRLNAWEDSGRDYSEYPGLDGTARDLAHAYPGLGIGRGYTTEGGYDDTDYAGGLWEVLRENDERVKPKHDPKILRRAAELVASSSDDGAVPRRASDLLDEALGGVSGTQGHSLAPPALGRPGTRR
jgi:hypothetical protein